MDFMNADWMDGHEMQEMQELPFAADGTAARTHLALQASLDSDCVDFDDHYARHHRACEIAIANLCEAA